MSETAILYYHKPKIRRTNLRKEMLMESEYTIARMSQEAPQQKAVWRKSRFRQEPHLLRTRISRRNARFRLTAYSIAAPTPCVLWVLPENMMDLFIFAVPSKRSWRKKSRRISRAFITTSARNTMSIAARWSAAFDTQSVTYAATAICPSLVPFLAMPPAMKRTFPTASF